MPNSLVNPAVRTVLGRLFAAAAESDDDGLAEIAAAHGARLATITPVERSELFGSLYIPVSPETGQLLYSIIRSSRPQLVVEFGTSFGIATIYLAAAVRDNGTGRVITTELNLAKAARAQANLVEAGVADVVEIVTGDALATLAAIEEPIGFTLLDGWKELYLDMLKVLEPRLAPGAIVAADDTEQFAAVLADYLKYVRDEANGYVSVAFPHDDGVELSCRT
jgi:predicted O-methyltransferase YrrM